MIKCNCGKVLDLPAKWTGYNPQGVPLAQLKCDACGWIHEILIKTVKSFTAVRSDNIHHAAGEYYEYKNGNGVKFSCPICKGANTIAMDTLIGRGAIYTDFTCSHGCGFHTEVILEDLAV